MQPRPLGGRLAAAVLAGQQAAREREVGQDADPEPLAAGQQLALGVALEERVAVLRAHEAREAALPRDPVGVRDLRGLEVRGADVAHLPLAHELVERAERLLERRDAVVAVVLVEVDPFGAQTPERGLDRPAHRLGRAAVVVAELRGQHHALSPAFEDLAEVLLALPVTVDVGRVEEGHARVERRLDDGARARAVDAPAEVVAAEADDRDLRPVAAEAPDPHAADCTRPIAAGSGRAWTTTSAFVGLVSATYSSRSVTSAGSTTTTRSNSSPFA